MKTLSENFITITTQVKSNLQTAWDCMFEGQHIVNWNFASDDWHCPSAESDIRAGGFIRSRMEAKDGSFGFDFNCLIDEVIPHSFLAYHLEDDRVVHIRFEQEGEYVKVTEQFDPENMHPHDFQQMGWQAILDNYKKYTESNA